MAKQNVNIAFMREGKPVREFVGTYDFGNDIKDAIAKFGADVVFAHYVNSARIQLQGKYRPILGIKKGADGYMTDQQVAADMLKWKPHVGRKGDPVKKSARVLNTFKTLPQEMQAHILAQLTKKRA